MPRLVRIRRWWGTRAEGVAALVPRLLALIWAIWALATGVAYTGGAPVQLAALEAMSPVPIWWAWMSAAALLGIGAGIPPQALGPVRRAGAQARGVGLVIVAGLLTAWAVGFFATDVSRGWVSGKNYLILALFALLSAYWIGRNRATSRRQPGDDANAVG